MKSIRFFFMFLVYIIVISIYYFQSQQALIQSTEQKVAQTLINHQALRKIVQQHYIPELKRLKEEGTLDPSYTDPIFSSGTFLTQKLHDYTIPLQLKTSKEATRFKYASLNPINPINKATTYEEEVFKKMLQNEVKNYSKVIEEEDKRHLFYATFFGKMNKRCLQCHGDPEDAPANQIKHYGSQSGYHFKEGDPSSLVIIRSPMEEEFTRMNYEMIKTAIIIFIVFLVLYIVSEWSIFRIKSQKKKISKTKDMLNKDPLTGLLNRRKFEKTLLNELNRAKRDEKSLVFFFLDIDYFKQYNDTYGHLKGDKTLVEVANALKECFSRSHESVYRLGGEEFGVITSTDNIEDVTQWSRNVLYAVESKHIEHAQSPHKYVTVSMGIYIALPDNDEADIKKIIKGADEALYEAKNKGRNKASLYKG
jgi:diguanylate cyclase (GGDEF)-like protein